MNPIRSAFLLAALLGTGLSLPAKPNFGVDCRSCHATYRDCFTLPSSPRGADLGGGAAPVVVGLPGTTLALPVTVGNKGSGAYAIAVRVARAAGRLDAGHVFALARDTAWTSQGGGTYFTTPNLSTNTSRTYNVVLAPTLAPDSYDLEVIVAGGGEDWGASRIVHLAVLATPKTLAPRLEPANGSFRLAFTGIPGAEYVLEASGSPATGWASVGSSVCLTGPLELAETTAAPGRFYRLVAR